MFAYDYWIYWVPIAVIFGIGYVASRYHSAPERRQAQQQAENQREQEIKQLKNDSLVPENDSSNDLILKNNEKIYFKSNITANWVEPRTHTRSIQYHGLTSSVRIMKGMYWRAGSIKPFREKETSLETILSGNLILTNKRLVMVADNGTTRQSTYGTIANIIPYSDAVGIMKNSGKTVYLTGNIDGEKIAIYLTRLISGDLDSHQVAPKNKLSQDNSPADHSDHSGFVFDDDNNPSQKYLTPQEVFDRVKGNQPMRLDEDHQIFDVGMPFPKIDDIKAELQSNHSYAVSSIKNWESDLKESSEDICRYLGNNRYELRAFNENFQTLYFTFRNGKMEYSALNDNGITKLM
ncbi:hypothetical protein FD41_GL000958 [Lentilactobacillus farraginis DSM 18382 = JCM 14108]|uniref:Uncharacterized protein n=1 Tax=Lentilactobacillus farraginis DSM 18382 = JCM 14108 TaxID=1423743 RepID=A0A0R1VFM5_9LACO|nr:hypothetical protein FD41_GL000958 [Lentilactobacillus farraginis DSM 18382 = JCM 14108]